MVHRRTSKDIKECALGWDVWKMYAKLSVSRELEAAAIVAGDR